MKNRALQSKKKGARRSRKSTGERFSDLAIMGEQVFHTDDLANLWNISHRSTLYMTLARYTARGLLHRIQKGLYSIKDPKDIHPYILGVKAMHGPAYISCEAVLFDNGVINQPQKYISIISTHSRRFLLVSNEYRSRKLSDAFLFNDAGITTKNGVRIASVPRAVADMLYFNQKKHFDVLAAVQWNAVKDIVNAVGYPASIMKKYADCK